MDFRLVPEVSITVPNGPALLNSLNALAREQIPFASAVTLKRMADLSVRRARGKMGERFTWGDCPVCKVKDREPCHADVGFQLGVMVDGRRMVDGEGAHLARIQKAPLRVKEVPA